jgi:hypothetical protein
MPIPYPSSVWAIAEKDAKKRDRAALHHADTVDGIPQERKDYVGYWEEDVEKGKVGRASISMKFEPVRMMTEESYT